MKNAAASIGCNTGADYIGREKMNTDNEEASGVDLQPVALEDDEEQEIHTNARALKRWERIILLHFMKVAPGGIRTARTVAQCIVAELAALCEEQKRAARLARNQAVLQDWRTGMQREDICTKHKISQSTFYRILKERH